MSQRTLNLGILAHVDAGKTTLTERLLFDAAAIAELGSVDAGTTQTDTLALERQRGITIRSAVASFELGDLAVNLIDTPGHPDFIAEVERALRVLDGAVLVVSAVEGVQPQTRVLMRALRRLRIPTLVFVNKIDRTGADVERVLDEMIERLSVLAIPMGACRATGTKEASFHPFDDTDAERLSRLAETLTVHDEALLEDVLGDTPPSVERLQRTLVTQVRAVQVHPVFFGSASTGAGVGFLAAGLRLLPQASGDPSADVSGTVFKIDRGEDRRKVAFVRLFEGTICTRDRVRFGAGHEQRVTAIEAYDGGRTARRGSARAGSVARLWGLEEIRIGDVISASGGHVRDAAQFPPPTLEAVVAPADPRDRSRLWVALFQLAEQDPLIAVRRTDGHELTVSLYGEVQKEVIGATLDHDFGVKVAFAETSPLCVERPVGRGEAVEVLHAATNPFNATLGLRVEPRREGDGVHVASEAPIEGIPLHLYRNLEGFCAAMRQSVHDACEEGLRGWQVTDVAVTVTACDYGRSDGPPSKRGPGPTTTDYRRLTPIVLIRALERAGTVVCQPVVRARLEVPRSAAGAVVAVLSRLGAGIDGSATRGDVTTVEVVLAEVHAQELQRGLANLTGGEGVMETRFHGYAHVRGLEPTRLRSTPDPRCLKEYVRSLA